MGETIKSELVAQGRDFIIELLEEGNTDEGFGQAFDLLGNVGLYMAACRRHDITEPSREKSSPLLEASGLALHLGASLGVAPRFATSHLATHNTAKNGRYKSFTSLEDEYLFIEYNTRGVFAYKRAADALVRILPMGVSHPTSYHLLMDAKIALQDVVENQCRIVCKTGHGSFLFTVCAPITNPTGWAAMNTVVPMRGILPASTRSTSCWGLCSANNTSYSQLLVDKLLYMMPYDQARLRDVMRQQSLLNSFLDASQEHAGQDWYQCNARLFLEVCQAHGETAAQHHDQLVSKFIPAAFDRPAGTATAKHHRQRPAPAGADQITGKTAGFAHRSPAQRHTEPLCRL